MLQFQFNILNNLLQVGTCKFILFFDCSNACMVERLLGRAKTSGRVDDNEETIKKRLKTFEEQTLPVLDVYEKQGKVRKVMQFDGGLI